MSDLRVESSMYKITAVFLPVVATAQPHIAVRLLLHCHLTGNVSNPAVSLRLIDSISKGKIVPISFQPFTEVH